MESADISPEIVLTPNGDTKDLQVQDVIEMEDGTMAAETTEDPATKQNKKHPKTAPRYARIQFDEKTKILYADVLFFLSHIFFPFLI